MTDRVLAGVVFIAGDKILLVLNQKDEDAYDGRWSIPKGRYADGIDDGLFAAAARELKEESGIDLANLGGRVFGEADCAGSGVVQYVRKRQPVTLHYFVVQSPVVLLDA